MRQQRSHRRTLLTGRDESRQFCETHQGIRTTIWVTVSHQRGGETDMCNDFPHVGSGPQVWQRDMLHGRSHTTQSMRMGIRHSSSWWAKFFELSWFRSTAKQSKLAEQWKEAHLVGKLKRADEHLRVINSLTHSARARWIKSCDFLFFLFLSCSIHVFFLLFLSRVGFGPSLSRVWAGTSFSWLVVRLPIRLGARFGPSFLCLGLTFPSLGVNRPFLHVAVSHFFKGWRGEVGTSWGWCYHFFPRLRSGVPCRSGG